MTIMDPAIPRGPGTVPAWRGRAAHADILKPFGRLVAMHDQAWVPRGRTVPAGPGGGLAEPVHRTPPT